MDDAIALIFGAASKYPSVELSVCPCWCLLSSFWVGSHLGSSCQVLCSRDIKRGTLDKLLGFQCKFISFVYEGWKQFTSLGRISIAVMNLLCHNSPCLELRILCTVTVEMISRAVFVTGISQGQNYTPTYLKQSCWPLCDYLAHAAAGVAFTN